ncbi:uncharacterized protein LOC133494907 isoform X2 [Syngnathoides biaculeatus]|uniref:uncharacterized protein LOC133494907 isoform X2 n=1 Tax=Syngnathoides biaculeatus TaxID=300417 RepID=UPI002ADD35F7|nr:uncharacterized protein LOC133494907 isoform X2 [Syngnathoides biaculeatus]
MNPEKNMTYSLKDENKDAKINNIIKSIVEKSTLDVANLRHLITLWDKEERAMSNSLIDESSYGVATQQKIKQHLKDFFSERLMIAEQEEGTRAGATSALRIFARTSAVKKTRDLASLDIEEEDDTGIFEEELSVNTDEQHTHLDDFSQTLDGSLSPSSSTSTTPSLIDKAKDLFGQVFNPVVDTIDTAGKTIVEKLKSTLQKTVGPLHLDKQTVEEPCVSERESAASLSPTTEENLVPDLASFVSSVTPSDLTDSKGEGLLDQDVLDQEATEDTCLTTGLLEGADPSRLRDADTEDQVASVKSEQLLCVPDKLENSELTVYDDTVGILKESVESTSITSNLDNDVVLSRGAQDSPEHRSSIVPPFESNKSPEDKEETRTLSDDKACADPELLEDGIAKRSSEGATLHFELPVDGVEKRCSSELVTADLELPGDWVAESPSSEAVTAELDLPEDTVAERSSFEAVPADLELPEDRLAKRSSSDAVDAVLELPGDTVAKRSSSKAVEADLELPEDKEAKRPSPEGVNVERMLLEDEVAQRSSSEAQYADLKWPGDSLVKPHSPEAAGRNLKLPEDQVVKRHSPEAVIDAGIQGPDDKVKSSSSSETLEAHLTITEDQIEEKLSQEETMDADHERHDHRVENTSLEKVDNDHEWQEDPLETESSLEIVHTDLKWQEDTVAKRPSLELVDTDFQWPEDWLEKKPSLQPGLDTDLNEPEVNVAKMSSSEAVAVDSKWSEDVVAKKPSLQLLINTDPKSPEDRVPDWSSSEAIVDADTQLSVDQEVRKPLFEVDDALQLFDVKRWSEEAVADSDSQFSKDQEVRKPLHEVVVDAGVQTFDIEKPSVKDAAIFSEGHVPERTSYETDVGLDTKLPEEVVSDTPLAKADLEPLSAVVHHELSEDRVSRKSLSEVQVVPKLSEDRVSQKSLSLAEVEVAPKMSEDSVSQKSLSLAEVGIIPKMSEDRVSRKSLSLAEVGVVPKLSEDGLSRKSLSSAEVGVIHRVSQDRVSNRSLKAATEVRKLSESTVSRRSSSKEAVHVYKLSEDRISRKTSSKVAMDVVSKLSEDRISRSSSRTTINSSRLSEGRRSKRSSSKVTEEIELKLSKDRISRKSLTETVLGIEIKLSAREISSEATTDLGKMPPGQLESRPSLWKRWKIRRPRKIQPILENCPRSILDCIGAKPAIRPIFKKVTSMWKTHYGRRKSKRVKTNGDRKSERPPQENISDDRVAEASVASSIISVELPPSDSEEEPCTRTESAHSVEDAHDIHSFFENMFKKEFSKRLEKSLKRGLLDVVNDYVPEKSSPESVDKPKSKQ